MRRTTDLTYPSCEEDLSRSDESFNEVLSPVRALLSTRDQRATYAIGDLGSLTVLVGRLMRQSAATLPSPTVSEGAHLPCRSGICETILRFCNRPDVDVPLSWLLSRRSRASIDNAVNGLEMEDVQGLSRGSEDCGQDDLTSIGPPKDQVLGNFGRLICLLHDKSGSGCALAPKAAMRR